MGISFSNNSVSLSKDEIKGLFSDGFVEILDNTDKNDKTFGCISSNVYPKKSYKVKFDFLDYDMFKKCREILDEVLYGNPYGFKIIGNSTSIIA